MEARSRAQLFAWKLLPDPAQALLGRGGARCSARVLLVLLIGCVALAARPAAAAASAVISPTVVLSSTAAGASAVTYEVDFTPTAGLAANTGTITVAAELARDKHKERGPDAQ